MDSLMREMIKKKEFINNTVYHIDSIYTSKLINFVDTRKDKLERRYYVEERICSPTVILIHLGGDRYRNIETDEIYTLGYPTVIEMDPSYSKKKQYVSAKHKSPFKLYCYDGLRREVGDKRKVLYTAKKLREILDIQEGIYAYDLF